MPKVAIDRNLLAVLRCPASGRELYEDGQVLTTIDGSYRYPVVAGIPCLVPISARPTHTGYEGLLKENLRLMREGFEPTENDVDSFINAIVVATCGNLFRRARLKDEYPIPEFPGRFPGDPVLEIGCNWGRWTTAGANAGYKMIGVDIHLRALLCAQVLSRKVVSGPTPSFVLADARMLPFATQVFAGAFSYSVLQHFSRDNVKISLAEVHRVLKTGGRSLIQMPNWGGLRSLLVLARRKFAEGAEFDVRYYSIGELVDLFSQHIGQSDWHVDCFLGLNVHAHDRKFVRPSRQLVIDIAEALRRASEAFPVLRRCADSVFVSSVKA